MDSEKIALRLRKLRGNKTQKFVAEKIGVKPSTYAMYEIGQRIPSDENKKKIADYFGKSVQYIFYAD